MKEEFSLPECAIDDRLKQGLKKSYESMNQYRKEKTKQVDIKKEYLKCLDCGLSFERTVMKKPEWKKSYTSYYCPNCYGPMKKRYEERIKNG